MAAEALRRGSAVLLTSWSLHRAVRRGGSAFSPMIKRLSFRLLRFSMIPFLIRELIQRKSVTIIAYHTLGPEVAEAHFGALQGRYNFISLRDYIEAMNGAGFKRHPSKALIVTFDDGHKISYRLKPVLEKYRIPATFFLCSGIVGTNRHFWFSTEMSNEDRQSLKFVADHERLEILNRLEFSETKEYDSPEALSRSQIEEMKTIADFQSHTVFHPILPRCSMERVSREIAQSKVDLEANFDLQVYALAYPNGDYTQREIEAAQKAGYKCALTLDLGFNSEHTPLFQLKRICVNDDAGVDELLVKISGLWDFVKQRLLKRNQGSSPYLC
jgi:peptidoglycan/xylan/chitin deacetylase (PgdA/CDA1 family)